MVAASGPGLAAPDAVRVVTDAGGARAARGADGRLVVTPPAAPTRRVRLLLGAPSRSAPMTVTEVVGLTVTESLAVPRAVPADTTTSTWLLRRAAARGGCLDVGPAWTCSPALVREGEDGPTWRRTLQVGRGGKVAVRATARPVPGPDLDAALDRALGFAATGSSVAVAHPAARPGAAVDADPATGWVATAQDSTPTLTVTLPAPVTLSQLPVSADRSARQALSAVVVTSGGEERRVPVGGRSDRHRIEPLTGRVFRFAFVRAGDTRPQQLRLPEISLPLPAAVAVASPCAVGPELRTARGSVRFAVTATVRQLVSGAALPARPCAPTVELPAGAPGLEARASSVLALDQVVLGAAAPAPIGRRVTSRVGPPRAPGAGGGRRSGVAAGPR